MVRTCKAHSHAGTNHSTISSQVHEDRRRQRHETAREETIEGADNDHGSETLRCDQTQSQDTGDESAGNDHVHRPGPVGDEVGDDSAEDGASVQDGKQIESHVFAGNAGLDGVGLHVEEDDVEAHEAEEVAQDEEGVCGLLERGKVEELAAGVGDCAHTEGQVGNHEAEEGDESDDAGGPGEANGRLEAVEDDGVDDSAQ